MAQSGNAQNKCSGPDRPFIIIVSGPPASGKTDLAEKIAHEFALPYINKDSIKVILFDQLGWSDTAWSRKLNFASLDILFYFAGAQLLANKTHILESNFKPEIDTVRFLELQQQFPCEFIQVQCVTQGEVLLERFKQRAKAGVRHPGHVDHEIESYLEPILLAGRMGKLEIGGSLFEVDTTDFSKIDYEGLFKKISMVLNRLHAG